MKSFILKNNFFLILLGLSLITRFAFLNYPSEVVFDEVHFGKFVSSYFTKEYYFDIHPPLGKLMIAGFAKITGYQSGFDFNKIGENFDSKNLFILRFLPAFFGALLPLVVFLILLQLKISPKFAFLGGVLTIFETAVLGQSKFILVDSFLLFFGFLSIYLYLVFKEKKEWLYFYLSALSGSLAFSIKWTGLLFLGLIFLAITYDFLRDKKIKSFAKKLTILAVIPFIAYYSIFAIHLSLLSKSGPGDAYMSLEFQESIGKESLSVWQKFIELNEKMYYYNSTLKASHPYSSIWYQWPVNQKPIWYWTKKTVAGQGNIYLIGNPIVFLYAIIGVISFIYFLLNKKYRAKLPDFSIIFLIGYFSNLLPYVFVSRVTFLYHYLPSLIFGIILFCILSDKIFFKESKSLNESKINNISYFAIMAMAILGFIILSPLIYGFPMSLEAKNAYDSLLKFF